VKWKDEVMMKKSSLLSFLFFVLFTAAGAGAQEARSNAFNDPFLQVTSAIVQCPVPEGPLYTGQEVRDVAHVRAQHGGSCFRVGRCRLANSYLYDAEIIPRVSQYIKLDGRFDDTSVWVQGERRLVFLKGCVKTREQSEALEKAVWLVDDVMGVVNYLRVGDEPVRYVPAQAATK
jgi:hypothetical protein